MRGFFAMPFGVTVPRRTLQQVDSFEHWAALLLLCSLSGCSPPLAGKTMSVLKRLGAKLVVGVILLKIRSQIGLQQQPRVRTN